MDAQELPPVENYAPEIYGAENQNWAISQSADNYIYVANSSGLLEFNGANWKLYPSPNESSLRSVNVIGDRIYTGCYMEFGYWEENDFGNLIYFSLSKKLKEPLLEEEFWNIVKFDNWVLFQSLHRIYIYNTVDESFSSINSKTNLPKVHKVAESIYFQKMNDGLYKIENGSPVLISNHPILQNNILVNIFSVDKKILLQTQEKGFYFFEGENLSKWDFPSNDEISSMSVYSSLQLADGSFIIGTISNGIYHIDIQGNLLNKINQKNGLNNNTVLSMFEDRNHNVWLGLDNGISVININSPFSIYNDIYGKLGTVYTSVIFNNNLYLGTNQGLFYKNVNSKDDFNFIKGTNGQVWCLKVIDDTFFCGHNNGTFIINDNTATLISDKMGTWDIKTIKGKDNLLLQGNYDGLFVLEKVNNRWEIKNKIEGFNISSRHFEMINNNILFVSHEYKGVYKLKINNDFTKVEEYSTDLSAPKGLKSSLIKYNNDLIYTVKNGIYRYNNKQEKFIRDSLMSNIFLEDDTYFSGNLVVDSKTNTLWGFTEKNVVYFTPGKLNTIPKITKIYLPASQRKDIAGFESMINLTGKQYLYGTSRGYIILNLDKVNNDKSFKISINSIAKSILNAKQTPVSLKNNNSFKFRDNNLFFTFSVPQFDKYTEVNYQYQLEGMYDEWSSWTTNSEVSFKNLPYGNYTFNVNAKIGNTLSNNIATYSFKIERPWLLSVPMLFIYLVLLITLLFFIHNLYKHYYAKQKQKLLDRKQRDFALSQLENEKVIMRLKNEKLQGEIFSKTRELSVSTMNIINKNELLKTIKDELSLVKDETNIKPVIKIINKNLANTSDWELFQEAFNNADSDFLKKVKSLHPALSPNDLRLCAYLRLNLSSKEIAPLLNISARSVEIKRYRLRKKMDLTHESSLVEYILKI
ncbi:MAG: LuxR family transcriptional regulator [Flavobacteriaceae bacterium]|nr:LuxR family transcriptional regulator [Flavobacteriaceae bacterium]